MATIVNTTPSTTDSNSNSFGMILAIVLVLIMGILLFVYGIPYAARTLRGSTSAPSIQVPDKVDVNVQQKGE